MACPRCQIETLGTRLCNHCSKTSRTSNSPLANRIVMDRQISGNWIRLHEVDDLATSTLRKTKAFGNLDTV